METVVTQFLSCSPLFNGLLTRPRVLQNVLETSLKEGKPLVIVSSVCPPYSSDGNGRPDYQMLEEGISYNICQHLSEVPKGIRFLESKGVAVVHFFLMADTEVDLLPFLKTIGISEVEFTRRCQKSVEVISEQVVRIYLQVDYERYSLPRAARFLEFFGHDDWYSTYGVFKERLNLEAKQDPLGKVAKSLEYDARQRSEIISRLLGYSATPEERVNHIIRQKAQYMAFAKLMRDRFPERLLVVNHMTPNFKWMNDKLVRENPDPEQNKKGNYLSEIPLLELDISTVPKEENV